jgi:hypothetical protein
MSPAPAAPAPATTDSSDLVGDDTGTTPAVAGDAEPVTSDPIEPSASEPAMSSEGNPLATAEDEPPAAADAPASGEDDLFGPATPVSPPSTPATPPAQNDEFVSMAEPARRWIHATGSHALVATLVDVVGDGSCILDANGQRIRVPLENLSGHDRDYVGTASVRIAARRDAKERAIKAQATRAPANTDTAGL